jgi:hypothetical protein
MCRGRHRRHHWKEGGDGRRGLPDPPWEEAPPLEERTARERADLMERSPAPHKIHGHYGGTGRGALDHMRLTARKFSMMRPTQGSAGAGKGGEGGEGVEVWWRRR